MAERLNAPLVQLVTLALWLGAGAFFSFVLAPALFATLPSRTLAGAVVGRTLPIVFYAGIVVGALVVVLQAAGGRTALRDATALCGCLIVVACGVAQFIVAPRIDRLRQEIGGPIEVLSAADGVALVIAWRAESPPSQYSSH